MKMILEHHYSIRIVMNKNNNVHDGHQPHMGNIHNVHDAHKHYKDVTINIRHIVKDILDEDENYGNIHLW